LAEPSNIQAVCADTGLKAISDSIRSSFRDAGLPHGSVTAICMGLAGIDWDGGLNVILDWAERNAIAGKVQVANDATLFYWPRAHPKVGAWP